MSNEPLYNDDVMELIYNGNSAYELLLDRIPQAERRFKNLCKQMRSLLHDVKKEFPDACYYTCSGGFHLLIAKDHHDVTTSPQSQAIALSGEKITIGDGDF